jgi:group I intron endonuclease
MIYTYNSKFPTETGIYKIWFECNSTKIYVGSALSIKPRYPIDKGFNRRWKKHLRDLKANNHSNPKIQNAYNKYGKESIRLEIIEICEPEIGLNREQFWLNHYDSYHNGFNCKPTVNSNLGKIFGEATRKKVSDNGKKRGEKTFNSVLEKHQNRILELYENFHTYKDIAKSLKIPYRSIGKILKLNNIKPRHKTYKELKKIHCFDLEGNLLYETIGYNSMSIISGINEQSIRLNVLNYTKTTHNLIFKIICN